MIRELAKKSLLLHSAFKFARDIKAVPRNEWRRPSRIADVFRVLPRTMVPMPRLFDAANAVDTVNAEGIPGDIVECGVWNGGCVGLMGRADRSRRTVHLFDSFEGLPLPSAEDSDLETKHDVVNQPRRLTADANIEPANACVGDSKDKVEGFLTDRLHLDRSKLVFHVGWFQDTVPISGIEKIAILRIDGDLYDSTRVCLEGLFDKVSPGGFVIIDDYGQFEGCRRAVDEFISERNIDASIRYSDSDCIYFRSVRQ